MVTSIFCDSPGFRTMSVLLSFTEMMSSKSPTETVCVDDRIVTATSAGKVEFLQRIGDASDCQWWLAFGLRMRRRASDPKSLAAMVAFVAACRRCSRPSHCQDATARGSDAGWQAIDAQLDFAGEAMLAFHATKIVIPFVPGEDCLVRIERQFKRGLCGRVTFR